MNPKDYEKNVLITESKDFAVVKNRVDDRMIRLLHAGLGLSSEMEELVDAVVDPGSRELDWVNISEEGGDLLWYVGIAVNAFGFDHDEISSEESGVEKYVEKYSRDCALAAISGLTLGVGKYNDILKKHLMYGREIDTALTKRTLTGICCAVSGLAIVCGTTIEKLRETNIEKLKARYGDKFTEAAALNRDLETERKILENGVE